MVSVFARIFEMRDGAVVSTREAMEFAITASNRLMTPTISILENSIVGIPVGLARSSGGSLGPICIEPICRESRRNNLRVRNASHQRFWKHAARVVHGVEHRASAAGSAMATAGRNRLLRFIHDI